MMRVWRCKRCSRCVSSASSCCAASCSVASLVAISATKPHTLPTPEKSPRHPPFAHEFPSTLGHGAFTSDPLLFPDRISMNPGRAACQPVHPREVLAGWDERAGMPTVPPLQLTTSPISSPLNLTTSPISSREERLATYRSPRSCYTLYTPRTNQEQLEITGTMLSEALEVAAEVAAAIRLLSSRAQNQRSDLIASSSDHSDANDRGACPICMEQVADPIACENEHSFCGECLRAYGRTTPRVRCPLCRVPMPALSGPCHRVYSGIAPT